MFSLIEETLNYTLTSNFWKSSKNWQSFEIKMTDMDSTWKPEDPFNFSHYIGVYARTSHVEDLILAFFHRGAGGASLSQFAPFRRLLPFPKFGPKTIEELA